MSPAEIVSELLYAGKTLREVAGYDDIMLRQVVFRKRDSGGSLVRHNPDLPSWVKVDERGMRIPSSNPVPFSTMFKQVKKRAGLSEEKIKESWLTFLANNPSFGRCQPNSRM